MAALCFGKRRGVYSSMFYMLFLSLDCHQIFSHQVSTFDFLPCLLFLHSFPSCLACSISTSTQSTFHTASFIRSHPICEDELGYLVFSLIERKTVRQKVLSHLQPFLCLYSSTFLRICHVWISCLHMQENELCQFDSSICTAEKNDEQINVTLAAQTHS